MPAADRVTAIESTALVGQPGFVGGQDDAPAEALLAQGPGSLGHRPDTAHDDERLSVRHGFL
jgi:hypothetical protein